MFFYNKLKIITLILYAFYSICNLDIATCEGLSNVSTQDLTNKDKTLGWFVIIGITLICSYLAYKGIFPPDSPEINTQITEDCVSTLTTKIITKIEERNITQLKDTQYLKILQEITKYN